MESYICQMSENNSTELYTLSKITILALVLQIPFCMSSLSNIAILLSG